MLYDRYKSMEKDLCIRSFDETACSQIKHIRDYIAEAETYLFKRSESDIFVEAGGQSLRFSGEDGSFVRLQQPIEKRYMKI